MKLPAIPHDKAQHALWGAGIFIVVGALLATLNGWPHLARPLGAAALGAGLAKELADHLANQRARRAGHPPPHSVDPGDIAWTVGGALAVWVGAALTEAR